MVGVKIRRAEERDAQAILHCLRTAFAPFEHLYTPEGYRDTVLTKQTVFDRLANMTLFVAEAEGEVVGTIGCNLVNAEEGHIRGMAVLPDWQGQQVAQQLLDAVLKELAAARCARVTLDTTAPLVRAMRFYERNGFGRSGKVTDFFGMPLYEYVKVLV
jgi:GNAT superfamily N-acetyltransferase